MVNHSNRPQWATGPRLLKLGETIKFRFQVPENVSAGALRVFPRYLEVADSADEFAAGGSLEWIENLPAKTIEFDVSGGEATVEYSPGEPGSYLAQWRVGEETLSRYFAVVEDDWIVLRFSTFCDPECEPTFHATGIPIDNRLPVSQFEADDPLFQKLLSHHRLFGDTIVPELPDANAWRMTHAQRVKLYGDLLAKARAAMPFPDDIRSARVEMLHDLDPGYTKALAELGIADHCGLIEGNAKPWLGMPEFPYFSSNLDCRKARQEKGGPVVAHQYDFCGGWHFLGPASWHYKAGEGDWATAESCLLHGLEEFRNLSAMSGHPAFVMPLYDGVCDPIFPKLRFECNMSEGHGKQEPGKPLSLPQFVQRYQQFMAFEAPKRFKVAYALSMDIADFYRRHYETTPRTLFVSKTDHIDHDMWWQPHWGNDRNLVTRERLPWETRTSTILAQRQGRYFKDPLSFEFLLMEDEHRSMRFERECPNPIWYFDYTEPTCILDQEGLNTGSSISHTHTPDVEVVRSGWRHDGDSWTIHLQMITEATFPDYVIVLWGLPVSTENGPPSIQTNAIEHHLAWNRDHEYHLVLVFELKPNSEITVNVRESSTRAS